MRNKSQNSASEQEKRPSDSPEPDAAESAAAFGDRLRDALESKGWTAYKLAQETGLSERHLEDIVAGRVRRPRSGTIKRIADVLGTPPALLAPGAVEGAEYVIFLTAREQDVLYAAGGFDRLPIAAVLRRGLTELVQAFEANPEIQAILQAVDQGRRKAQETSSVSAAEPSD